jgi:hypothetical protein
LIFVDRQWRIKSATTNKMAPTKKPHRDSYIPGTGTVTRSISFEVDTFKWMEKKRKELRLDRSGFMRIVLEDISGIRQHPELHTPLEPHPTLTAEHLADKKPNDAIDQLLEKLLEQKLNALIARDAGKLKKSLGDDKTG